MCVCLLFTPDKFAPGLSGVKHNLYEKVLNSAYHQGNASQILMGYCLVPVRVA